MYTDFQISINLLLTLSIGNLNVEHRVYLLFNLKLKSDVSMDKAEQWIKEGICKIRF